MSQLINDITRGQSSPGNKPGLRPAKYRFVRRSFSTIKVAAKDVKDVRLGPVIDQVKSAPITPVKKRGISAAQVHRRLRKASTLKRTGRPVIKRTVSPKLFGVVLKRQVRIREAGKRNKIKLIALPTAALMLFVFGIVFVFQNFKQNEQVEAGVETVLSDTDGDGEADRPRYDENKPSDSDIANYFVDPNQPRYLRIPKYNVTSRVYAKGLLPDGTMDVPWGIFDTGWYSGSAKPGKSGAMLIAGHVHGYTTPGVFYNLKDLAKGDVVEVERGDGKIFKYEVAGSDMTKVKDTDMKKAVSQYVSGKQGLNLITCAGDVIDDNHYDQRLVVYTARIN